ncbi:MAG: hypothetical protein HY761_06025 [Candidatus Omnitrophica bacterium]|nr:hypothetical protein [Candidatus Omnitrophota bacterium]
MKLNPYSKNSERSGLFLKGLIFSLTLLVFLCGCSASTKPTYQIENIAADLERICKDEYKIDIKAKQVGSTLWIYMPVENILIKSDKPEKYTEKFAIEKNTNNSFKDNALKVDYAIKAISDTEKTQDYKYNKDISEKINDVWVALRRILFSLECEKINEPKFFCMAIADIKNGFILKETFFGLDIKKVSYQYISMTEYQHRSIQDMDILPQVIGDKDAKNFDFKEVTMEDFLAKQIEQRIRLKFQKPEVNKDADIDKEIIKIIAHTLKTYGFKDFDYIELNNNISNNKITLNQGAILAIE